MIKIQNLDFSYSSKKELFKALNLELEPGKIYGLLGKNGTGKSTLLKLMNGLLFPTKGKISLDSFTPMERKGDFLEEVFFLPEEYIIPNLTIGKYVSLYSKFYKKFDVEKFSKLIHQFELKHGDHLKKLSFGNKKKVLIAFALATNCNYLFLDEPSNGLDIPTKTQLRQILPKEISDSQCVIISTHQIRDLAQLMESIIIIDDGQILLSEDLYQIEEKLLFSYHPESNLKDSIYSEKALGRYTHILPNPKNEASEIDLEILFNAIITKPQLFKEQFK